MSSTCEKMFFVGTDVGVGVVATYLLQVFLLAGLVLFATYKVTVAKSSLNQQQGQPASPSFLLLPIYRYVMWILCLLVLIANIIMFFMKVKFYHDDNTIGYSIGYAVVFALRQIAYEVVTLSFMSAGAGKRTYFRSFSMAAVWALITFGFKTASYYLATRHPTVTLVLEFVWGGVLFFSYLFLTILPSNRLVSRRPAVRLYAAFWVVAYCVFLISTGLRQPMWSSAYCVHIAYYWVIVLFWPYSVYRCFLDDSAYWQGAMNNTVASNSIASVLQGGLNHTLAMDLVKADTFDVELINYAALTIDPAKPPTAKEIVEEEQAWLSKHADNQPKLKSMNHFIIESGSMAKVYRGKYRQDSVAIKLIYAPELTTELIRNLFQEASIMSALRFTHVTGIKGMCVMPPAIALVMELCMGSLHDLLHKPSIYDAMFIYEQRINRARRLRYGMEVTPSYALNVQPDREDPDYIVLADLDPETAQRTISSYLENLTPEHEQQLNSGIPPPFNSNVPQPYFPPFPLAVQLRLAIDCVTGLAFLHTQRRPVMHLDVKGGNFLIGFDGIIKVADLELATHLPVQDAVLAPYMKEDKYHKCSEECMQLLNTADCNYEISLLAGNAHLDEIMEEEQDDDLRHNHVYDPAPSPAVHSQPQWNKTSSMPPPQSNDEQQLHVALSPHSQITPSISADQLASLAIDGRPTSPSFVGLQLQIPGEDSNQEASQLTTSTSGTTDLSSAPPFLKSPSRSRLGGGKGLALDLPHTPKTPSQPNNTVISARVSDSRDVKSSAIPGYPTSLGYPLLLPVKAMKPVLCPHRFQFHYRPPTDENTFTYETYPFYRVSDTTTLLLANENTIPPRLRTGHIQPSAMLLLDEQFQQQQHYLHENYPHLAHHSHVRKYFKPPSGYQNPLKAKKAALKAQKKQEKEANLAAAAATSAAAAAATTHTPIPTQQLASSTPAPTPSMMTFDEPPTPSSRFGGGSFVGTDDDTLSTAPSNLSRAETRRNMRDRSISRYRSQSRERDKTQYKYIDTPDAVVDTTKTTLHTRANTRIVLHHDGTARAQADGSIAINSSASSSQPTTTPFNHNDNPSVVAVHRASKPASSPVTQSALIASPVTAPVTTIASPRQLTININTEDTVIEEDSPDAAAAAATLPHPLPPPAILPHLLPELQHALAASSSHKLSPPLNFIEPLSESSPAPTTFVEPIDDNNIPHAAHSSSLPPCLSSFPLKYFDSPLLQFLDPSPLSADRYIYHDTPTRPQVPHKAPSLRLYRRFSTPHRYSHLQGCPQREATHAQRHQKHAPPSVVIPPPSSSIAQSELAALQDDHSCVSIYPTKKQPHHVSSPPCQPPFAHQHKSPLHFHPLAAPPTVPTLSQQPTAAPSVPQPCEFGSAWPFVHQSQLNTARGVTRYTTEEEISLVRSFWETERDESVPLPRQHLGWGLKVAHGQTAHIALAHEQEIFTAYQHYVTAKEQHNATSRRVSTGSIPELDSDSSIVSKLSLLTPRHRIGSNQHRSFNFGSLRSENLSPTQSSVAINEGPSSPADTGSPDTSYQQTGSQPNILEPANSSSQVAAQASPSLGPGGSIMFSTNSSQPEFSQPPTASAPQTTPYTEEETPSCCFGPHKPKTAASKPRPPTREQDIRVSSLELTSTDNIDHSNNDGLHNPSTLQNSTGSSSSSVAAVQRAGSSDSTRPSEPQTSPALGYSPAYTTATTQHNNQHTIITTTTEGNTQGLLQELHPAGYNLFLMQGNHSASAAALLRKQEAEKSSQSSNSSRPRQLWNRLLDLWYTNTDLTNAKDLEREIVVPQCLYWLAPEIIRREPFGLAADVYSVGCVIAEIMTRQVPYCEMESILEEEHRSEINDRKETAKARKRQRDAGGPVTISDPYEQYLPSPEEQLSDMIAYHHFRPTLPSSMDPVLQNIVRRCWHHDPAMRPSLVQVLLELRVLYDHLGFTRGPDDWYGFEQTKLEAIRQGVDLGDLYILLKLDQQHKHE